MPKPKATRRKGHRSPRNNSDPLTERQRQEREADDILRRAGRGDLADLGERPGRGYGEVIIQENLKRPSLETIFRVTENGAPAPEPAVHMPELERYAKIAMALKIPSRIVRESCQNLKRFLRSTTYRDRLDKLRSGKSWMRPPEKAHPVSFLTSGRPGTRGDLFTRLAFIPCSPEAPGAEPFRVTLFPEEVEWTWNIERYGREPQELRFRGSPQAIMNLQEQSHIVMDSFGGWILQQRPKMRRSNLHRARQIALWYLIETSGLRRLPADN